MERHLGREADEIVERMNAAADSRAKQKVLLDWVRTLTDNQVNWLLTNSIPVNP